MKKKQSRRRKAGELTPEQARAALARWYSNRQQHWQNELIAANPDWLRLFELHNDLIQIEIQAPYITEY